MRIPVQQDIKTYKEFARVSFVAFGSNLPNFILCLIAAMTSNTIVIWVDTLVSLGETLHTMIAWLVGHKLYKESGDKYNFGMERLEVFASFICNLLMIVGMFGILVGSVLGLKDPMLPSESIWLFCILKVSNSTFDLVFLIRMKKICREHNSKLNQTERLAYRSALINDVTMGVIVLICYIFRDHAFVQYFSPVASIVLAVYFIIRYVRHIRSSISEITDVSLPIAIQDEIYDVVLANSGFYQKITSVNCRRLNTRAHIEISLVMKDYVTYAEMQVYLEKLRQQIRSIEDDAEVVLVIEPPNT